MQVLAEAEFNGAVDCWTEFLCLQENPDATVTLSSCSRTVLAEAHDFSNEEGEMELPEHINGERVWGIDGDFVVGEQLVPHNDDAVIILSRGDVEEARAWLEERGWHDRAQFPAAWAVIEEAMCVR
jgi:hypothetical protein